MNIKLCIFDLDGTLIDTIGDISASGNYALEKNNFKPHLAEKYKRFVGNGSRYLIKNMLGETEYSSIQFEQIFEDYSEHYSSHSLDTAKPYEGITLLLEKLNEMNIGIAILSNKPDAFVKNMVSIVFPKYKFKYIIGNNEIFPLKPNPASLLYIITENNFTKDECLYIGDSNVDIETAKNGYVKSIGVAWGFRGKEELIAAGADFIVEQPNDILDIILQNI